MIRISNKHDVDQMVKRGGAFLVQPNIA